MAATATASLAGNNAHTHAHRHNCTQIHTLKHVRAQTYTRVMYVYTLANTRTHTRANGRTGLITTKIVY